MSGPGEDQVQAAIATLGGDLRESVASLAGRIDTQAALLNGKLAETTAVLRAHDTAGKDFEQRVAAWQRKAEEKCEDCHGGFNKRLTDLERWKWHVGGGLAMLVIVLNIALRLVG